MAIMGACSIRVYPRPRGEPGPWIRDTTRVMGLSPPTRGTPVQHPPAPGPPGSIPAHAGNPHHRRRR